MTDLYQYIFVFSVPRPSDPYAMPGLEEDVPRPPTVKADDLKSMELVDDEDGGWAGHHEEVDYSKEVIFSDSSDDEASPKDNKKVGWENIVAKFQGSKRRKK